MGFKLFPTFLALCLSLSASFIPSQHYALRFPRSKDFIIEEKIHAPMHVLMRGSHSTPLYSSFNDKRQNSKRRRKPPNSQTALRWVVEGIKKLVVSERRTRSQNSSASINSVDDDAKLIEGLHMILEGK